MKPFEREFAEGDADTFASLVSSLSGLECTAWRKGYGSSGSLHFGELRPKAHPSPRAVHSDEGQWFLQLWDCDRTIRLPEGNEIRSEDDDEASLEGLGRLVGLRVAAVEMEPRTLALRVRFVLGSLLILSSHPRSKPDEEQWNLVLPTRQEIVLWPRRRWALRAEGQ